MPILYTSRSTPEPTKVSTNLESRGTISLFFEYILTLIKQVSLSRRETIDTIIPIRYNFIGRDNDVLSLKFLFSITYIILLYS